MVASADGYAIDLRQVTKVYRRRVHALQGITMQVKRGEIFGLLGPNGAGKSTLVKIMMTVVRPTHAEGMILGHPVGHKPTLARVGYLPENHRFPKYLTGRQTIEFFSALAGADRPTRKKRTGELLNIVGMTEWADRKISEYSKGMLQRIGIAQALGADPDLVVLDEPTDGVDPGGRRDIRDVLLRMRSEGKTVFVNSHLLSELETVCDRVAILVQGSVARQGTIDELTVAKQCYLFEIEGPKVWQQLSAAFPGAFPDNEISRRTAMPPPAPGAAQYPGQAPTLSYRSAPPTEFVPPVSAAIPPLAGKFSDGTWCDFDGRSLRVGHLEAAAVQPIIDGLRAGGLIIRKMNVLRPSLEDLFFEAITNPTTGRISGPGAAIGKTSGQTPGGRP